ncbi:methionine--tRNA ligase, cytoplasmic-like, partial [Carcharodon carcharias]|uniref:methionine--tRNA ligase, cytoplasmic-like n=1 Tax=Carcharodon carcharias TaxID=13397 RepID=UPI001B7E3D08
YFFDVSGKKPSDATDQWLEWEAVQLRPAVDAALHQTVMQGRKREDSIPTLTRQLSHLNQALIDQATPCLTSDTVTVADVVVWGALYPVLQDAACLPEEYAAVHEWLQRMNNVGACQQAVTATFKGQGAQIFKPYLQKQPAPAPAPLPETPDSDQTEDGEASDRKVSEDEMQAAEDAWRCGMVGHPKPRKIQHP